MGLWDRPVSIKKGDQGMHSDFRFKMTAENIANFIGKNAYTANKIIMTDLCDGLICESIYDGFIMTCPDQNLYREIITHLASIKQGSANQRKNGETLGCGRRGSDAG